MPWHGPQAWSNPGEPTRGQLVQNGLLLLPESIGWWFGGGELPLGLFDRLAILGVAALMLLLSYALGEFTLSRLKLLPIFPGLGGIVLRLAVGLTIVSWLTAALGMFGLLHYPLPIALGLVTAFVGLGAAWKKERLKPALQDSVKSESEEKDCESLWWLLAALPLLLFIVGVAMMPPFEYDVLEYHTQVPKQWYQAGQISVLPGNAYSGMPMGAEMWSLLPMVFLPEGSGWFDGVLVGKTIIGLFTLLTAGLLYGAGRQLAGVWCGRAAAVAALATPWLAYESGTGLVDGVWAFFTLAALYPVLLVLKEKDNPSAELPITSLAILSGLMAGMAFDVKYPALLLAIAPVLALWIYAIGINVKALGLYLAAIVLVTAPWLIKNTIDAGNPVYPLAGNVFPTDVRSEAEIQQWNHAHQVPPNADGARYSFDQLQHGLTIFFGSSPWVGLAIAPLAICGLFSPHRKLVISLAAMLAVCWIVWWGMSHRLERFLMPAIPMGCLLAGLGAAKVGPYLVGRIALRVWLGLGLVVGFLLVNQFSSIRLDPRIFVTLSTLRQQQTSEPIAYLNEHVKPGEVVLATGDAALFYLEPPALSHTCFDPAPLKPLVGMTKSERQAWLGQHHIGWVYVDWAEIDRFRSPGNYGFPDYVTRDLIAEMKRQGLLEAEWYRSGKSENPSAVIFRVRPAQTP